MNSTRAADEAVAAAKDVPDLVAKLKLADPALAAQIEGKALLRSKTPWGTLACAVVAYASTRWGLGWDPSTDALIAGCGLVLGSYAMRAITSVPISGLLRHTPVAPAKGTTP